LETRGLSLGEVSRVEIFGEFSEKTASGSWGVKIPCLRSSDDASVFIVHVDIKIGNRFKFIIDGGRTYAVSSRYLQTKDVAGNLNNIFQFHCRSQTALKTNPSPLLRYPKAFES